MRRTRESPSSFSRARNLPFSLRPGVPHDGASSTPGRAVARAQTVANGTPRRAVRLRRATVPVTRGNSLRGPRSRADRLEVERRHGFYGEDTVGRVVAGRLMPVASAGLEEVGARSEPELGLSLRDLDVGPRNDHDLHVVGMRVKGSCESRRQAAERAEGDAACVVAPKIRDLDARGSCWVEIRPLQVAGREE